MKENHEKVKENREKMKEKYNNETSMAAEASIIPNLEAFTYKALTPRGGGHRFASPRLAAACFVLSNG